MAVDGACVFTQERCAQCADRSGFAAAGQFAEEDVAGVLSQDFGEAAGVLLHVGFDALHAGLCEGEVAFVCHVASDGDVGVFVFIGESDADVFAGRGFQTTRTLDVHEEEFDRVFCVTEDGGFAVERAAVDLVARVIRNEAAAFKSAFEGGAAGGNGELGQVGGVCAAVVDDAAVGTGLADVDGGFAASQIGGQGDGDEVVGDAVDGEAGFACGFVIAEQDGLVVAGDCAGGVTVVADLPRGEIAFEEMLGLEMVEGRLHGLGADILPACAVFQFLAA